MQIRSENGKPHFHHHLSKNHSYTMVNRDSHLIKKSTSPPFTPTGKTNRQTQPVIIYTHAPRVIHTKPQEFKNLVQKLTGYTGNKNTTSTTKNDSLSPQPLKPHLPPPSKGPVYYDFDEFETKNVVPLANNNLISIDEYINFNCLTSRGGGGDGGFFAPPILDPPIVQQANGSVLPFFAPAYGDQFCCTNNNICTTNSNINSVGFVGTMNKETSINQTFYGQDYIVEDGSVSGCYNGDGVPSSIDLSSSDPSSMEEALDNELADFY